MATNPTKGKLVDKLRQVARGPVAPMGFGRTVPTKQASMVLIVALDHNDPALVTAAVSAGADALVLSVPAASIAGDGTGTLDAEKAALQKVSEAAGEIPWGLSIDGPGAPRMDFAKLRELGADFVIAPAAVAPASLLMATDLGHIISIERDFSPFLVRALNELPVDAVAISHLDATPGPGGLSVLDVMRYREVVDMLKQSVITNTQGQLKPEDVPAIREAGVRGLLLDVRTVGTSAQAIGATTKAFREAIDAAGGPLSRGGSGVILPQVRPSLGHQSEEPLEPEEPDEDE
jgi:hypothetical protein